MKLPSLAWLILATALPGAASSALALDVLQETAARPGGKPKAAQQGAKAAEEASDDDEDDDDDDDEKSPGGPPDSWPTTYIDLETGWSSTPGNTIGFGRHNLRHLTSSKSRGFYLSAPLTIELTDRVNVFAGFDGSASQSVGLKWDQFTPGSWIVGGSADVIEQSGWMPTVTLSASVSRPLEAIALGVFSTTWNAGLDLDYGLNDEGTTGLSAGVSYSRTQVSSSFARVGPQLAGYIGAYWSPSDLVNLSAQVGVQYFGGAEVTSLVRMEKVTTPYAMLELEHVDDDDNRVFAVNLAMGWSPKPTFQVTISTPLYLAR